MGAEIRTRDAWSHQKLRKPGRILPWSLQEEYSPVHTLTLAFWAPELREDKFLLH